MPAICFRTTVDAEPEAVYDALATEEGLAGNWTDQLVGPRATGEIARFGFGRREPAALSLTATAH